MRRIHQGEENVLCTKTVRVNASKRYEGRGLALKPLIPRLPPGACKHRRLSIDDDEASPASCGRSRHFFFSQRTAKGCGISLTSWVSASNFTDNEVARIAECRCSSLVGKSEVRRGRRQLPVSYCALERI